MEAQMAARLFMWLVVRDRNGGQVSRVVLPHCLLLWGIDAKLLMQSSHGSTCRGFIEVTLDFWDFLWEAHEDSGPIPTHFSLQHQNVHGSPWTISVDPLGLQGPQGKMLPTPTGHSPAISKNLKKTNFGVLSSFPPLGCFPCLSNYLFILLLEYLKGITN